MVLLRSCRGFRGTSWFRAKRASNQLGCFIRMPANIRRVACTWTTANFTTSTRQRGNNSPRPTPLIKHASALLSLSQPPQPHSRVRHASALPDLQLRDDHTVEAAQRSPLMSTFCCPRMRTSENNRNSMNLHTDLCKSSFETDIAGAGAETVMITPLPCP